LVSEIKGTTMAGSAQEKPSEKEEVRGWRNFHE
jgi:hypothetical protein